MLEILSVSFMLGLTAVICMVVVVVRKYKRGLTAPIYPIDSYTRLNLISSNDIFLNRTVTRVRVQSSSNKKK